MKELRMEFIGIGEVRAFTFKQLKRSNFGYIYEVSDTFGTKWYEVFRKKENARFGTLSYPGSKSFGVWAWTVKSLEAAEKKLDWIDTF